MEKERGHCDEDDNHREKERGFDSQINGGGNPQENDESGNER